MTDEELAELILIGLATYKSPDGKATNIRLPDLIQITDMALQVDIAMHMAKFLIEHGAMGAMNND